MTIETLVAVAVTVFLSVFAHGMTTVPAPTRYARTVAARELHRAERESMEQMTYRVSRCNG